MGIISWLILGLIAGFIGSKIVNKRVKASGSTSPWASWVQSSEDFYSAACSAWKA
jgi:hypothetical protein